MKYYKQIKDGEVQAYHALTGSVGWESFVEITEDEYHAKISELQKIAEAEQSAAEQSKDERIAELEAENAALLYQVLTGEELTDV